MEFSDYQVFNAGEANSNVLGAKIDESKMLSMENRMEELKPAFFREVVSKSLKIEMNHPWETCL